MKNVLILLAGGHGKRFKSLIPKQFVNLGNYNLIEYFLSSLDPSIFNIVIISASNKNTVTYLNSLKNQFSQHKIIFALSGKTRQESSKNSLIKLAKYKPSNVLIHDAARPLASNKLIRKIVRSLQKNNTVIPYIKYNGLSKIQYKSKKLINNNQIINIQTPQGFKYKTILKAHKNTNLINVKDDSILIEEQKLKLKYLKGENTNLKITFKEDIDFFNKVKKKEYKSGIGYDIHKINLSSKKKLRLCGVKIDHPPLIGHSDADVGYHAVCDSILGALSLKDIGYYFNDKNIKWKNANSKIFVQFCSKFLIKKGYKIVNLDINFICETPNIRKISNIMKTNLSKLLNIKINQISIKATTNEKLGFIGKGEGIAAESIIQIVNV